jgi:hypothetical protein
MLIMNKDLYNTVVLDFPGIAREMADIADIRDRINNKAKCQLINYLKSNKEHHIDAVPKVKAKATIDKPEEF